MIHYNIPMIFPSQYRIPSPQLVTIPYKITGPAIVKILHPIPYTCPSVLYSIADATTELANPVIGTSAPAPPHFTSLPYRLKPVSRALISISISPPRSLSRCRTAPQPY